MQKNYLYILLLLFFTLFLFGCEINNKNDEKIDNIISSINNLPSIDNISINDEIDINSIRDKINSLLETEKNKIENYSKFIELENKIKYLKEILSYKINEIEQLIDSLINKIEINLNDEFLINVIDNSINELTPYEQSLISNINEFNEIKLNINNTKALIEEINLLIENIPNNISLNDASLMESINLKYNSLSNYDKQYINDINVYLEAEVKLNELKFIESFRTSEVLNCISDVLNSDSTDNVILSDKYNITWSSSNENLVSFVNNKIKVSKVYQTHKKQIVTISASIELDNNETIKCTKDVTVNPVKFEDLSDTPVASYYQSTALNSYKSYSERYLAEKTLFSEKAKFTLDIVYYAFGNVDKNGNITITDPSVVPLLNKLKENDVRTLVSVAGISTEGSYILAEMTSDDAKLSILVNNIMNLVELYNFDGVDVDWESAGEASVVANLLNRFLKALRDEMDRRQDEGGSKYLLTTAIPATADGASAEKFDFKTINKYVDYVNMMSYELQKSNLTTHGSALYSSSVDNGYGYSCDYAVKLFTSLGLEINKIILGVASYGKTFRLNEEYKNSNYPGLATSGTKIKLPNAPGAYATGTVFLIAIKTAIDSGKFKKYIEYNNDGKIVGSYLFSAEDNIFITYDSEEIIQAKYEYASQYEGMGIMNWAYTQDTTDSYVNTIYDILVNNK